MLKDQKILMVCKEANSYSFFFLAKLLSRSNKIKFFFILPQETLLNKSKYNRFTYYRFLNEFPNEDVLDFNEELVCMMNKIHQKEFDYSYLKYIEYNYCQFKNLNELLISSQAYTRHLHDRFYTRFSIKEDYYKVLELSFKKIISIIEDFSPDMIIDSNDETMFRGIINEVANKSKIPYIVYDYPRYKDFKIPSFTLGAVPLLKFKYCFNQNLDLEPNKLIEEYREIDVIRSSSSIMSDVYVNSKTSQYTDEKIIVKIRKSIAFLLYLIDIKMSGNTATTRKPQFLFSNGLKHYIFFLRREYLFAHLSKKNKYFFKPNAEDRYVYFPLHMKPESTTFVRAPYFIDDLHIIKQISKSLPIGIILYVKEHQSMIGERSLRFYREVNKIPNVKLVQFNYYSDPKPWIINSLGVITVTGTSAFEAALLGKKSILFGNTPFNLVDGVTQIDSYSKLKNAILLLGPIENKHMIAAYIRTVRTLGVQVDEKKITFESLRILQGKRIEDPEFNEMIVKMALFYEKSYGIYEEELALIDVQSTIE